MNENLRLSLERISKLEKNWDSYGGDPIGRGAITAAGVVASILNQFTNTLANVVPTADGGIALEWYKGNDKEFSINFTPEGAFESFFVIDDSISYEFNSDDKGSVSQSAEESDSKSE